ncbi:MAG: PEP-CTERM sorting domain-containing protein [Colwellia sp.]|nr:PEP-CTERM sorting domain-containing protein [Colwellia sp.]
MIKLFIKLFFVFSFVLSSVSQASLITALEIGDLSSEDYIVFEYNDVSYDVAWASKVNSERWYIPGTTDFNTLFAPTIHSGWEYASLNATNNSLEIFSDLSGTQILDLFTDSGNNYIQAFKYWNSEFSSSNETGNILTPQIRSEWAVTWADYQAMSISSISDTYINNVTGASYDTFYIRPSLIQGNGPTPVPEPSTLMIFALGLIALASKNKLFS